MVIADVRSELNKNPNKMSCKDAYTIKALTRAPRIEDILAQNAESEKEGTQLKRSLGILDLLGYGGELFHL